MDEALAAAGKPQELIADAKPAPREKIISFSSVAVLDTARFDHMYRIANAMASASLIPDHLKFYGDNNRDKNKPVDVKRTAGNCFLIVNQAVRWDMCPFSLMAGSYVVGGKVSYEGKVIHAVVNARAGISGRLKFSFSGEKDGRTITVSGTFAGDDEPSVLSLSVGDLKAASQKVNPMLARGGVSADQKLVYSGSIWWARRFTPELILGVIDEGENDAFGATPVSTEDQSPMTQRFDPVDPPPDQCIDVTPVKLTESVSSPKEMKLPTETDKAAQIQEDLPEDDNGSPVETDGEIALITKASHSLLKAMATEAGTTLAHVFDAKGWELPESFGQVRADKYDEIAKAISLSGGNFCEFCEKPCESQYCDDDCKFEDSRRG